MGGGGGEGCVCEDMEFQKVSKKIPCGISKGDPEKRLCNFQGPWFLVLEIPRDLIQFCGISRAGVLFCLEFPEVN